MAATPSSSRFGPFLLDRTRYQLREDERVVELTPKLLDLLLFLVDRTGELVTKEQLLDTLWPDANVTDNALTQAVSELRAALGDDPAAPKYIKTVARRGYRFVAEVSPGDPSKAPEAARSLPTPVPRAVQSSERSIAVLDFSNLSGDADTAWMSAGIAETVTADLSALERFRIVDRRRVAEATRRTDGSMLAIAADLGLQLAVVGSYQTHGDRIRITSRIVDVAGGEAIADAKVDGLTSHIFDLQDQVVAQFSKELGVPAASAAARSSRETASLEAYRHFTEGWLELETLEVDRINTAIGHFERSIALDRRYAVAHSGLANAHLAAYEDSRVENRPAADSLRAAIGHARGAVALDAGLAEAHATLAFVLVSAWETEEARQAARRAVDLEPSNWKHHFRLGHAAWGDERLRAADATLNLYPEFAFAHFQAAMVHIARGQLRQAETVLRHGAAIQDRQFERGERYPALGLHWLLALVRLAQDDPIDAMRHLDLEQQLAQAHRLYGREFQMSALHARGACELRLKRLDDAALSFREALALYPRHAQSWLGLTLAFEGVGPRTAEAAIRLDAAITELSRTRPLEAALVAAQRDAANGDVQQAVGRLHDALAGAPPGFAGWTLPIEPFLHGGNSAYSLVLRQLADRAA